MLSQYKEQVKGRARLGVQAFAEALLIIPKAIAQNAGHDQQEAIVKLQQEYGTSKIPVGLDVTTGMFLVRIEKILPMDLSQVKQWIRNLWVFMITIVLRSN